MKAPIKTHCHPERSESGVEGSRETIVSSATRCLDAARHDKIYGAILVGKVGFLFAAAMKAIPMTTRKNEKN